MNDMAKELEQKIGELSVELANLLIKLDSINKNDGIRCCGSTIVLLLEAKCQTNVEALGVLEFSKLTYLIRQKIIETGRVNK